MNVNPNEKSAHYIMSLLHRAHNIIARTASRCKTLELFSRRFRLVLSIGIDYRHPHEVVRGNYFINFYNSFLTPLHRVDMIYKEHLYRHIIIIHIIVIIFRTRVNRFKFNATYKAATSITFSISDRIDPATENIIKKIITAVIVSVYYSWSPLVNQKNQKYTYSANFRSVKQIIIIENNR